MKKFFEKHRVLTVTTILLGAAGAMQACGKSSGSGSNIQNASQTICGTNAYGQPLCNSISGSTTAVNTTLYQACSAPLMGVTSANYEAATDTGVQVCRVTFQERYVYHGIEQFLGPSATYVSAAPLPGIVLAAYDRVTLSDSGSSGSGLIALCTDGGSNFGASRYVEIIGNSGANSAPVAENLGLTVPAGGSGILGVGMDKSGTPGGCFYITMTANITRCVDSSGTTHPCL